MSNAAPEVKCYILAGGTSRRMGFDKRTLRFEGETLLERAIRIAREALGSDPVIVGDNLTGIVPDNILAIPDARPQCGPLGALVSALEDKGDGWVLLLGADLPYLTPADIRALVDSADSRLDVITLTRDGRAEPVAALYNTTAKAVWRRQLELKEGRLALHEGIYALSWKTVEPPSGSNALFNINEPGDLPSQL